VSVESEVTMSTWKLPPRSKVFEAFTALADGRVRITGSRSAVVTSSLGTKAYDVEWSEDGRTITANDNASYWQGYLGYPALAVLLLRGQLDAGDDVIRALAGVPWHDLNVEYRRDYDAVVSRVLDELPAGSPDRAAVERAVDGVLEQLAALDLQRAGRGRRPPKAHA
jgi:hypothetical protein